MFAPDPIRSTILPLSLVLLGCGAGWRRIDIPEPGPLPARQQVQVWHRGETERWHALVVSADSVSGIPFRRPVSCDSCRLALPRAVHGLYVRAGEVALDGMPLGPDTATLVRGAATLTGTGEVWRFEVAEGGDRGFAHREQLGNSGRARNPGRAACTEPRAAGVRSAAGRKT